MADGTWRWTSATPAVYASAPGVSRMFCAICGTPMAYRSERWPGEIHFYAASLDDPLTFTPEEHVHWDEHLPWLAISDDLPRR